MSREYRIFGATLWVVLVAVDLFAGPGGFSEGLRMLGHSEIGVEWDDAACATARAAGHERLQADVSELDPLSLPPTEGLIASPPCPTFSSAGNGNGRLLTDLILSCAREFAAGRDTRAEARAAATEVLAKTEDRTRAERDAAMSILVVEPLRWALARRPTWIALEQVPPVLPIWRAFAEILREHGWHVWTGILEAERYGVPQTRERAILMAHRDRQPHPPAPTHQRYVPGEPQRHDFTLEGEILPWVSMAEALGWGDDAWRIQEETPRAREAARTVKELAPTMLGRGGAARKTWVHERPAPTIVGNRRSKDGGIVGRQLAPGEGENTGGWGWQPRAECGCLEEWVDANGFCACCHAHLGDPAGMYALQGGRHTFERCPAHWSATRPATNVNGDPRISKPGRHDPEASGSQQEGAIRVTPQEAAILQSFRPDYPWQGSRSRVFMQIGNAVPPLLARAILAELVTEAEALAA